MHGRELSSVDRSASSHSNGVDGEEEDEEKTCKEVVKGITERLKVLCGEAGSGWDSPEGGRFLKEEVSLPISLVKRGSERGINSS